MREVFKLSDAFRLEAFGQAWEGMSKQQLFTGGKEMEGSETLKKFETAVNVAPMLGLTQQALYEAVKTGLVPAIRIGRRIRFDLDALRDWAANGGKSIEAQS
jgi:excisionase family DNA binding protein